MITNIGRWITLWGVALGMLIAPLCGSAQGEVGQKEDIAPLAEIQAGPNGDNLSSSSYTDTYPGKLVPFAGMIVAVLIVWLVMAMVQKTDRNRHETIRKYLEQGIEVPFELLVDDGNPQTWKPVSDLRKACIWLAIGLGIGLTGWVFSGTPKTMALGLVFDFIGLGYLIVWKIEPTKVDKDGNGSK